jgi:putative acetyltransferase
MERVRPYADADAQPLHDLFRQATRYGAEGHYTIAELEDWAGPPDLPETWAQRHADNITLVAEADGRITGYMMMHPDGYLDMAFVRPDRRRTGTAPRLYDAILAEARARNLPRLTVLASRLMERFLLKRGWRTAPELAAELGEIPQNRAMALEIAP